MRRVFEAAPGIGTSPGASSRTRRTLRPRLPPLGPPENCGGPPSEAQFSALRRSGHDLEAVLLAVERAVELDGRLEQLEAAVAGDMAVFLLEGLRLADSSIGW